MPSKKLKIILVPAFLLILLFTVFILLLGPLVNYAPVQRFLLGELSKATGYELRTSKIDVRLWRGPEIDVYDLVARPKAGPERIAASKVKIHLDPKELLNRRIVPDKISLLRPKIETAVQKGWTPWKPKAGEAPLLEKIFVQWVGKLVSFSMKEAQVCIKGLPFELEDLNLDLFQESKVPIRLRTSLDGKFVFEKERVQFRLQGTINSDEKEDSDLYAEMTLKTGKFPVTWVPWPNFLPVEKGLAEADIKFKGTLGGQVSAKGKIVTCDNRFSVVWRDRKKDYSLDRLLFDFDSLYSEKMLEIPSMRLSGPDFSLSISSKLDFRDSSNPHFDLRVESPFMAGSAFKRVFPTPFARPWVEERLLPILTGGDARLELYSMNGTLDQIKHLRRPENAGVLFMKISWKDLEVLKDGGGLPFERVSGELSIERRVLSVSLENAVFGNSTINCASLNVSRPSGVRTYHLSVDGLFDLDDLKQQEKMDLIPSGVRQQFEKIESMSGGLEACVQVGFEDGWVNTRLLNGEFRFRDCSIEHDGLFLPLSLDEGDFKIDEKGQSEFQGTGLWGKSEFQVSGTAQNSWKTGKIQIVSRADMNEIIGHFYQAHQLPLKFQRLVPCRGTLSRRGEIWSCQGEVALDGVAIATESISIDPPGKEGRVIFGVELHPGEKAHLKNFRCNLGESTLELTGSYDLKNKDFSDLKVSTEKLLLEDLGIRSKKTNTPVKGILRCRMEVNNFPRNLSKTSVTGEIDAQNISFALNELPSPINDCHFKLEFSGKDALIHSLKMRVGQSTIDINGYFRGWNSLKGELAVNADYLDFSDFKTSETGIGSLKLDQNRFFNRSDMRLDLKACKGLWKRLRYGPAQAECVFRAGDFYVEQARFQMEHGVLTGKGHVKRAKGPERLFFASDIKMTKQPVDDLLYSLGFGKKALDGALTMEAKLSAKGMEKKELFSGLTGSVDFHVEEGRIRRKGIVFKVLDVLSIQNIYKARLPDFLKEGFYFEDIEGHFDIEEGILKTENLTIKSPVFNAVVQGKVVPSKKKVKFVFWVQTLETMDIFVSKIPIIGYILTGKEKAPKGVVVYPVEVKGHWSDPEVKYVPSLKQVGSGVINIFKRILHTPGRIFKEISEMTGEHAKEGAPMPEDEFELDGSIKPQRIP